MRKIIIFLLAVLPLNLYSQAFDVADYSTYSPGPTITDVTGVKIQTNIPFDNDHSPIITIDGYNSSFGAIGLRMSWHSSGEDIIPILPQFHLEAGLHQYFLLKVVEGI
jgi:hypothetical protein